jgi:SPW repeat-containing protein
MRKWRRESVLDVYNLALAMLLFVSPWLFAGAKGVPAMNIWASSAAVAAISLAAIFAFANWEEWANLALGIWLVISPWVLGFTHTSAMHFCVGIGAMVAFLAILELLLLYDASMESVDHRR